MQSQVQRLLIRADASLEIGAGHLMRCLALAQGWRTQGGVVTFLTACRLDSLNARLTASGFELERLEAAPGSDADLDQTYQTAERTGAAWVVLDGYQFSAKFQDLLKRNGTRVLAIDDYGQADHYSADLILNQNLHANEGLYRPRDPHTSLLLGTRYVLLRPEFQSWIGWKREVSEVGRKILITMGGSQTTHVTLRVLEALRLIERPDLEVEAVLGGGSSELHQFQEITKGFGGSIRFHQNVSKMSELMAWADIAVAAGGTTTWERALLGLPSLIVVLADNQRDLAESAQNMGLGWNLGPSDSLNVPALADTLRRFLLDSATRASMAQRGPEIVDGHGTGRVIKRMRSGGSRLQIRRIDQQDCRKVWEWANEPLIRSVSFNVEPIAWEQHQQWFTARLNHPSCLFWIAEDADKHAMGQLRLELDGPEATISISLDPRFRGMGYGPEFIRLCIQESFQSRPINLVHAFIREDNTISQSAFLKAGFFKRGTVLVHGHAAHHLVYEKGHPWETN